MNYWWVVANDNPKSQRRWHWRTFFSDPDEDGANYNWGGPDWINSSMSHKRIAEMRKGDLIVTYQSDVGVLGLATLASDGYKGEYSERFDCFDLNSSRFISFKNPISWSQIRDLPQAQENLEFAKFHQGTVFRIKPEGFDMLLQLIVEANPSQKNSIENFLGDRGLGNSEFRTASVLKPPKRIQCVVSRVVRDTPKTRQLKRKYEYRCQVCNERIEISSEKFYAEVHHLRPLGGEHAGLDDEANMIVVCPDHHAYFDLGVPRFQFVNKLLIGKRRFVLTLRHKLAEENVAYHNNKIFGENF